MSESVPQILGKEQVAITMNNEKKWPFKISDLGIVNSRRRSVDYDLPAKRPYTVTSLRRITHIT